jgi:hypothetical protein
MIQAYFGHDTDDCDEAWIDSVSASISKHHPDARLKQSEIDQIMNQDSNNGTNKPNHKIRRLVPKVILSCTPQKPESTGEKNAGTRYIIINTD